MTHEHAKCAHRTGSPSRNRVVGTVIGIIAVITVALGVAACVVPSGTTTAQATTPTNLGGADPIADPVSGGYIDINHPLSVDDDAPAVSRLNPDLHAALRKAAIAAASDGVELRINSGWRSSAYQADLFTTAVQKHGSKAEAARWVAPPTGSRHVTGDAADIGPSTAAAWLGEHGAAYGLCRTYDNEGWHFEFFADAATGGCPRMYFDAASDPRVQH